MERRRLIWDSADSNCDWKAFHPILWVHCLRNTLETCLYTSPVTIPHVDAEKADKALVAQGQTSRSLLNQVLVTNPHGCHDKNINSCLSVPCGFFCAVSLYKNTSILWWLLNVDIHISFNPSFYFRKCFFLVT